MINSGVSFDRTQLDDGLITGVVEVKRWDCEACGAFTLGVRIDKITLPKGLKPLISFTLYHQPRTPAGMVAGSNPLLPIRYIGITCGCYAKAHRQIAHITTSRKARRK